MGSFPILEAFRGRIRVITQPIIPQPKFRIAKITKLNNSLDSQESHQSFYPLLSELLQSGLAILANGSVTSLKKLLNR